MSRITKKSTRAKVLAAVSECARYGELKYASKEFQNDREIVLAAIKNHGSALKFASDELKNDEELIRIAFITCGYMLSELSPSFRNNKEIVLIAVRQYGDALWFASEKLRNDEEVVITALKQNRGAERFITSEMKSKLSSFLVN